MRFLIVPNFSLPYDQRMVNGLAAGFREIGYEAVALSSPVLAESLAGIVERTNANVVIQVNRFRPQDPPLPPRVRPMVWIQDVFPDTADQINTGEREGDIVYALGDANVLGLNAAFPCVGSLVTGVDPMLLKESYEGRNEKIDFSLCGYIPSPFAYNPSPKADLFWLLDSLIDQTPLIGHTRIFRYLRY